ncbi:MAG: hypothetical protein R3279_13605, partial [Putridiphycobacter sp.]|nr:hypothetical protein [Putridiphycobacter sp.]
ALGLSMMVDQKAMRDLATDSYKVIRVNGKIVYVKTKSPMKQGDLYVDGTDINFDTEQSRAAIINKITGRCVLSPAKKGKAIILPAANNINSRSGAIINKIDIKNHFSENYLVIGKMMIEVSENSFPQNEKSFFYLAYDYNGELIRKKLPYSGNKLILDRADIFTVDNQSIPVQDKEMALYYMDDNSGEKLAEFKPVFPDLDNLKAEVLIILSESDKKTKEDKIKEVTAYLNEFYGKPQKDNLASWLASEFEL